MTTIIKNNIFLDILKLMVKDDSFALFHREANEVISMHTAYSCELASKKDGIQESRHIPEMQQLYLNGKYYVAGDAFYDAMIVMYNKEYHSTDNNFLFAKLNKIKSLVLTEKLNSPFLHILKRFFENPEALNLLNSFLKQKATYGYSQKGKNSMKVTKCCIDLGTLLLEFVISSYDMAEKLISILSKETLSLSPEAKADRNQIYAFAKVLVTYKDDDQKKENFPNLDEFIPSTTNKKLSYYCYLFLKYRLFQHAKHKDISLDPLYEIVMASYSELGYLEIKNQVTQATLSIGYYLIDMFVHEGIFKKVDEFKADTAQYSYILQPEEAFIQHLTANTVFDQPLLLEKELITPLSDVAVPKDIHSNRAYQRFLSKSINNKVHRNIRITTHINNDSYLNKGMHTKFSIDVLSLTSFLEMLVKKDAHSGNTLLYLYNLKTEVAQIILDEGGVALRFFGRIINYLRDFSGVETPSSFLKALKIDIQEQDENNLATEKAYFHKHKIFYTKLINQAFQRKVQLIQLIKMSIKYSIYKYVIFVNFIDGRGRVYNTANALSMHTNPLAKMFVKMYDPAGGVWPTKRDLNTILGQLNDKKSRLELQSLIADKTEEKLKETFIKNITRHILGHLKCTEKEYIRDMANLNELSLIDYPRALREYLWDKIKKGKKLLEICSVIYFERLRITNSHTKHISNSIELDASSSGLQMMAVLFKSKELAKLSNLYGKENYDIYQRASDAIYAQYQLLEFSVSLAEKCFLLNISRITSLAIRTYTNADFRTNNIGPRELFLFFLTMDFSKSSCVQKTLMAAVITFEQAHINSQAIHGAFLSEKMHIMFALLPRELQEIYKDYATEVPQLPNFSFILQVVLCLRYAVRIVYNIKYSLKMDFDDINSVWRSRNLTKDHVMTLVYGSTSFGRKEKYREMLEEYLLLPDKKTYAVSEVIGFLEISVTLFLKAYPDIALIQQFAHEVSNPNGIRVQNKHLLIKLNPKATESWQVSCPSFYSSIKRPPQLRLQKQMKDIDMAKLRSMLMANIAHMMDSDLIHTFAELLMKINAALIASNSECLLNFERNHDCYFLNNGLLLRIFVKDCYRVLFKQNYINNILDVPDEIKQKYSKMSHEDFIKELAEINNYFIK